MTKRNVIVQNLRIIIFPILSGTSYWEGRELLIDGCPLPYEWTKEDWNAEVGSQIYILNRSRGTNSRFQISGVVQSVDWRGEKLRLELTKATFEGEEDIALLGSSIWPFGNFVIQEDSWEEAVVEPTWLFPAGYRTSWENYQMIVNDVLQGWKPVYPLSLSELYKCVWLDYPGNISVSHKSTNVDDVPYNQEALIDLINRGYFRLANEVKRTHDAIRLARRVYSQGWPSQREEVLNLWFSLQNQSWLWVRPNAVYEDHMGLEAIYIRKNEFSEEALTGRLLNPEWSSHFLDLD